MNRTVPTPTQSQIQNPRLTATSCPRIAPSAPRWRLRWARLLGLSIALLALEHAPLPARAATEGDLATAPHSDSSAAEVARIGAESGLPAPASLPGSDEDPTRQVPIGPAELGLGSPSPEMPVVEVDPLQDGYEPAPLPAPPGVPAAEYAAMGMDPAHPPLTLLMRSGHWFVFPRGCETVRAKRDVILHFHGAYVTMIPRYLATKLDALLVIINEGIGSGRYTDALALKSQVDGLLARVEGLMKEQCGLEDATITRLALSSWSAGYGATEQFLRRCPDRVDAVLLSDGLHVGFADKRARTANVAQLEPFIAFAGRASRGEKLLAITHSAIEPETYAGAGATALALSEAAHAPTWPVAGERHAMRQLTASRRGFFYVDGFAGTDKAAHAQQLYSIGDTLFARLREYWER